MSISLLFLHWRNTKTGELRAVNGEVLWTVRITVEEVLDVLRCMKVDTFIGQIRYIGGHCGS